LFSVFAASLSGRGRKEGQYFHAQTTIIFHCIGDELNRREKRREIQKGEGAGEDHPAFEANR
jgi:hypothetical protein